MINLGDKNWGVKDSGLLAYKQVGSKYFNKDFDFTRASNGTYIDKNGVLQEIATNVPRVDFSDGVGALLLEPQRSNLILKSEPTSAEGVSIGVSYESFDWGIGFNNCVRYPDNSTLYLHYGGTCLASTVYTLSYYIKMDNGQEPIFGTDFSHRIGNVVGTSPTLTNMGNGVYRVSETKTSSTSNLTRTGVIKDTINSAIGFRITALQLEQGTYPTSYIKTEGSQVTRIADVANNCGTEQDFNSEEGVLYAEVNVFDSDSVYKMIELNDGTNNNRITIYFYGSNIYGYIKSNGTLNLNVFSAKIVTNFNKVALKYNGTETALWINSVKINTGSATSFAPHLLNKLNFAGAGYPFYGKARSVKYFPTALTDEELENLTTI